MMPDDIFLPFDSSAYSASTFVALAKRAGGDEREHMSLEEEWACIDIIARIAFIALFK